MLSDVSIDVHALLREITIFEKTITSVTAPQMAKNILEAIFRSKPPCLSPSFRGTEAVGPLFRRRLNASVCEHFTLNKSRISCAQRPMEFMMRSNQGLAHTGVSRARQADSYGPRTGLGAQLTSCAPRSRRLSSWDTRARLLLQATSWLEQVRSRRLRRLSPSWQRRNRGKITDMRKRIREEHVTERARTSDEGLLIVDRLATVEVTSEQDVFPIESVFAGKGKEGWRASKAGEQMIRLIFDRPVAVNPIQL